MNNFPRETLRKIIAKYGTEVCGDARRCESLLNDLCGAYRREINVLVNAVEEKVPLDLLAAGNSMPHELLLTKLEKRLTDDLGLTQEAAQWGVESWALALGAVSEKELEERARKSKLPTQNLPKTDSSQTQKPAIQNKPPIPNFPPVVQPRVSPPIANTPVTNPPQRMPAQPPVIKPANNPPLNIPQAVPGEPAVARRKLGFFRGCFIIFLLLTVLSVLGVLVVPYAFEAMRETQRERNNEPPRFPR